MKTAAELYPDLVLEEAEHGHFYGSGGYQPILSELGEILIQVDDDDWQGDSRVLYKDGDRYGYLQFGWGSCSGCDALQACSTIKEIQELMDSLQSRIQWFDDAVEAYHYFNTHDWEGDYSWHDTEQKAFVQKVLELLEPAQ